MTYQDIPGWGFPRHPVQHGARRLAARTLRRASAVLAQLATRLAGAPATSAWSTHSIEFHADAGAPEGALYVDGRLLGYVRGVTRL